MSDNGAGIKEDILKQIEQRGKVVEKKANHTQLGIPSVITRIKLLYGNGYGLTIESKLGVGTTVRIKLPVVATGE